jgi:hypothetical protein
MDVMAKARLAINNILLVLSIVPIKYTVNPALITTKDI